MKPLFRDSQAFVAEYKKAIREVTGKKFESASEYDRVKTLCDLIADEARDIHAQKEEEIARTKQKRVYYFSLEFLIGPLLQNYLLNLGILDTVEDGLKSMGTSLEKICSVTNDPGLGNGGLGRLAACFLDAMASLGIAGYGNGMRYKYGLFKQVIKDGRQVEEVDNWLAKGYPWEVKAPESSVVVHFGGDVRLVKEGETYKYVLENTEKVLAVPYDIPIVGYNANAVNKLRVWSAEPYEENFNLDEFNAGNYAEASKFRTDVEAISAILYPNDMGEHGKILRLKQEYLFVAAGIKAIVRTFKRENGSHAWEKFPELIAVHTNDTHPALCGPELMCILIDEEGLSWDEAWDITTKTLSYTNHTVLPEALEKWPIMMVERMLPRIYSIIEEINRRYREELLQSYPGRMDLLEHNAILWDNEVRMANLSVICSHSVNGVAKLHTEILERDVLHDFYETAPEKFNNKTNGICIRRFLGNANRPYAKLITEAIGDGWLKDARELAQLEHFRDDEAFLAAMQRARLANKEHLARYVKKTSGVELDPNTIYDVQVKRFHAYKRQLLNILKVMDLYNQAKADPHFSMQPTSFIFSGKAAQSYTFAKEVIRLINSVASVVNQDPATNELIKVAFVPNFSVSSAEIIYPAADISEQISTAGQEASGTSNMKLMANGAITLGTLDGANVEIMQLVGEDNIKIFGAKEDEIEALKRSNSYNAHEIYDTNERLRAVMDQLKFSDYALLSGDFNSIFDNLLYFNDPDFVMLDFDSYTKAFMELNELYPNQHTWNQKALANTAHCGFFSADRTIKEYAADIWHVDSEIVRA